MTISLGGLFGLVIFGLICYLIDRFIPMIDIVKVVFRVVVLLICILWLLSVFGLVPIGTPIRLQR